MIPKTWAYFWNAAYDPNGVILEFDYESEAINANADDGGNARLTVASAYDENSSQVPAVGQYLIIKDVAHAYYGRHEILTVHSSTSFTIDFPYDVGASASGDLLYFERIPTIELWKGYKTGFVDEEYVTELPLTLVATFTPRPSPNWDISINLAKYLQDIFTLTAPVASTDFTLFNRFRLKFDGAYSDEFYHVVNSAISSETLNELYADTGRWLTSENPPFVMSCGNGVLTKITDAEVINAVGDLLTIITTP
jgi:hypothetical protein